MAFKLLADESVDFRIIKFLRENNIEVLSIWEEYSGITDEKVIKIARLNNCILLAEDSDFGEYVFAFQEKNLSVIFLRYSSAQIDEIKLAVLKVVNKHQDKLYGKFIVITPNKIRIRELF